MVKRTSLEDASCPVARALDAIGDWWALLIVRESFAGVRRFGDFQKRLGLAKNILSTRLRSLVAEGILETRPASDGSAYQEYVLTRKGRGLYKVMIALHQWGHEHLFEADEPCTAVLERATGKPLPTLEVRSADGTPLAIRDLIVLPSDGPPFVKPA